MRLCAPASLYNSTSLSVSYIIDESGGELGLRQAHDRDLTREVDLARKPRHTISAKAGKSI